MYAFSPEQILMISEPAICLGALFIPYRRNASTMKSIMSSVPHRNDISMIYCHADIRGAFMNDGMRSQEGLEVTDFPPSIPVYSGHFHKPHTVSIIKFYS